jgi:hypothetical protein
VRAVFDVDGFSFDADSIVVRGVLALALGVVGFTPFDALVLL